MPSLCQLFSLHRYKNPWIYSERCWSCPLWLALAAPGPSPVWIPPSKPCPGLFLWRGRGFLSRTAPLTLLRAWSTWLAEAASPLLLARSFLPRVQWALCGPTPSLFRAVYLLNVGYYSRRERKRERKGENNIVQELVIPVFHLPRPAARRGAAFAMGMCCYNTASDFLWM